MWGPCSWGVWTKGPGRGLGQEQFPKAAELDGAVDWLSVDDRERGSCGCGEGGPTCSLLG